MTYTVQLLPDAVKAIEKLSPDVRRRIIGKVERMQENLAGDVKRLTNYSPEYRLRVGDWRVLFEVEETVIVIYDIIHRSKAYG